jgi:hypothetical protein
MALQAAFMGTWLLLPTIISTRMSVDHSIEFWLNLLHTKTIIDTWQVHRSGLATRTSPISSILFCPSCDTFEMKSSIAGGAIVDILPSSDNIITHHAFIFLSVQLQLECFH